MAMSQSLRKAGSLLWCDISNSIENGTSSSRLVTLALRAGANAAIFLGFSIVLEYKSSRVTWVEDEYR